MFISAVKLGLLEPASSGHSKNCSFWYFRIGSEIAGNVSMLT